MNTKFEYKTCEDCNEITKKPVGFYDGMDKNGINIAGTIFHCSNQECKILQNRIKKDNEKKFLKHRVKLQNEENGINVKFLMQTRVKNQKTLLEAANLLGISAVDYCAIEHEKKAISKEQYQFLLQSFGDN